MFRCFLTAGWSPVVHPLQCGILLARTTCTAIVAHFLRCGESKLTLPEITMEVEDRPLEDNFSLQAGGIPLPC